MTSARDRDFLTENHAAGKLSLLPGILHRFEACLNVQVMFIGLRGDPIRTSPHASCITCHFGDGLASLRPHSADKDRIEKVKEFYRCLHCIELNT